MRPLIRELAFLIGEDSALKANQTGDPLEAQEYADLGKAANRLEKRITDLKTEQNHLPSDHAPDPSVSGR